MAHFINGTLFDFYTKRQATVEMATFSSEFVAGRVAVDQTVDNRITLRYFGVPVKGPTILFCDNESVVKNASVPHSQLKKKHVALAYHCVREAIAAGIVELHHIPGMLNYSDILSKHWGHSQVWHLVKALLFKGEENNETGNKKREANSHALDFGELHRSGANSNIFALRNVEEINVTTEYEFNDIFNMSENDRVASADIPSCAGYEDSIAPPTSESMSR